MDPRAFAVMENPFDVLKRLSQETRAEVIKLAEIAAMHALIRGAVAHLDALDPGTIHSYTESAKER